jgi:hypothetical protein
MKIKTGKNSFHMIVFSDVVFPMQSYKSWECTTFLSSRMMSYKMRTSDKVILLIFHFTSTSIKDAFSKSKTLSEIL